VRNRRRVVYYAILLLLILGEILGERNYIIIIFPEYDKYQEYDRKRQKNILEGSDDEDTERGKRGSNCDKQR